MQAPYPPPDADRANELYWGSELSVKQIADELDLSRGALYGLLEPLGAVHPCPECGGETAWANRTARDRHQVACPECGWEGSDAGATPRARPTPKPGRSIGSGPAPKTRPAVESGPAPEERPAASEGGSPTIRDPARVRIAAGGALLGAAAGLALVLWNRRR